MWDLKNTLIYLFIGAPLAIGVVVRFVGFHAEKMLISLLVTTSVFGAIGIGYGFVHFKSPPQFFVENGLAFIAWPIAIFTFLIVWAATETEREVKGATAAGVGFFLVSLLAGTLEEHGLKNLIPVSAVVLTFCVAGAINSVLGPISAGFTLSATAYSIVSGDGISDIFLWKHFFEYFEISNTPIKVIVLLGSAVLSVGDTVAGWLD